jgi:hypothetical protein
LVTSRRVAWTPEQVSRRPVGARVTNGSGPLAQSRSVVGGAVLNQMYTVIDALSLAGLIAATLRYALLMRRRECRRAIRRDGELAADTGLQGVFLRTKRASRALVAGVAPTASSALTVGYSTNEPAIDCSSPAVRSRLIRSREAPKRPP